MSLAVNSSSLDSLSPIIPSGNDSFIESERPQITMEDDSIFELVKPKITKCLKHSLPSELIAIITNYVIDKKTFDHEGWKKFFGVKTEELELEENFFKFWFAKDARTDDFNFNTHFSPFLFPKTIRTIIPTSPDLPRGSETPPTNEEKYNFDVLTRLAEAPKEGHPSRCDIRFEAIRVTQEIETEDPCWIVVRKEIFARGLSADDQSLYMTGLNEETGAGYEELPGALELSTAALIHHVVTGKCFLGDKTGLEGCLTLSRCNELVAENLNVIVGAQTPSVTDDNKLRGGLTVSCFCGSAPSIGVTAIKKVSRHNKIIPFLCVLCDLCGRKKIHHREHREDKP